jgi:hypothetical protein
VLPGFAPAGEALLFRQKAPKPLTHRLASFERTDAILRRADQFAEPGLSLAEGLKQGPPAVESVPSLGQTEGVGLWKTEHFSDSHERARSHIFCMIRKKPILFVETLRWSVFKESTDLLTGKTFQASPTYLCRKAWKLLAKRLII